jgi:hypothetical protein
MAITVILLTAESNAKTVTSLFTLLSVLGGRSNVNGLSRFEIQVRTKFLDGYV